MLILPAGISRRLPAAALGIIRDSRFVCTAPASHSDIRGNASGGLVHEFYFINMQHIFDVMQIRLKQLFVPLHYNEIQATLLKNLDHLAWNS